MKVYLHNFFHDMDLSVFLKLFELSIGEPMEFGNLDDSSILLESMFGYSTMVFERRWKYTFLFLGESDRNIPEWIKKLYPQFTCVLKGEPSHTNIVNFPLFVLYKESFRLSFDKPILTRIPPKNVCVIVSNVSNSEGRNTFCDRLDERIQVDYAGNYKNNIKRIDAPYFSKEFVDFVSDYKFIITMENSKNKTYITEKILHGFCANTIPVYWGSDSIQEHFNEDRFIHVKTFEDTERCIQRMVELIENPSKYLEMLNQPIVRKEITIENIAEEMKKIIQKNNKTMDETLVVNHNAGLFSCYTIRLFDIIDYFNKNKKCPRKVDSTQQFIEYKNNKQLDYTHEYIKENNLQIDYLNEVKITNEDREPQFSNYKHLNFECIKPFVDKYFSPSERIVNIVIEMEKKYNLDYDNIAVFYYRGTDKCLETNLCDYNGFIEKAKQIKEKNKDLTFIIVSDEINLITLFTSQFQDTIVFNELLVNSSRSFLHSQYMLAIVIMMSKCKHMICSSSNVSFWVLLFKGHSHHLEQYLAPKDIIYGVRNKDFDSNRTAFWL